MLIICCLLCKICYFQFKYWPIHWQQIANVCIPEWQRTRKQHAWFCYSNRPVNNPHWPEWQCMWRDCHHSASQMKDADDWLGGWPGWKLRDQNILMSQSQTRIMMNSISSASLTNNLGNCLDDILQNCRLLQSTAVMVYAVHTVLFSTQDAYL